MDEFVRPPKRPFKSSFTPKLDQLKPPDVPEIESQAVNLGDKLPENKPPAYKMPPVIPPKDMTDVMPVNDDPNLAEQSVNIPEKMDIELDDAQKPDYHIKPKSKRLSKKKLLIIIGVAILVIAGAGAVYWFFIKDGNSQPNTTTNTTNNIKATPTPTPKPISPLTGLVVADASLTTRPVTSLMIENSYAARPQSGLLEADIVFEAIAEGGITRFLALYQESQPQYIGPVRSLRPYFLDFAYPFNAGIGHVGGSPDALRDVIALGARDLDQFANAGAYWRISERAAPHNMYTSFEKLDALNKAKGYNTSTFTGFERKKDVPQTPTAVYIDFSISSSSYSPRFQYDAATNSYKRFQDGEAHIDQKSKAQISPKVVIALVMQKSLMSDGSHTVYQDVGSNKMFVFQDGIASEGTWQKTDRKSQFVFTDINGLPMKLNAGQTWISIVDAESDVSYKL